MLQSEFYERTGVNLSGEEYANVEHIYTSVQMNKDEFCQLWLKNRDNKIIDELMNTIKKLEKDCKALEEANDSLVKERDRVISQSKKQFQKNSEEFDVHMKEFGRKIIVHIDDNSRIYDACEEEFGLDYICRVKLEERLEIKDIEREHLIKML